MSTTQIEEKPRVIIPRIGRRNEIFAILLLAVLTTVSAGGGLSLSQLAATSGRLALFLARSREERIPLSAFHFGSGYTSRGKRRYA